MARPWTPSTRLLRYLRAQEHGRCLSHNASPLAPTWSRSGRAPDCAWPRTVLTPSRTVTTFTPSYHVPLESSLFAPWPRGPRSRSWSASRRDAGALSVPRLVKTAVDAVRSITTSKARGGEMDSSLVRLFGFGRKRPRQPLQPDDLPSLASTMDESPGPGRSIKPVSMKLRCTEFDGKGVIVLNNGEFKKSELIAKYGLLPRDLRKIDSSLLPNILVRPSAILINLLHLRVLIKHDRVLVFDAYGSSDTYTQSLFMYDLEQKLRSPEQRTAGSSQAGGALPYEFRALESVLVSVTTGLEGEFEGVREPVVRVLRELEEDIDRDKLRHLLIYSKKLSSFEQKARLVRDAIDDLLEADDDLAAMYLTEKEAGGPRGEDDHTEVEMLLESYYKICDEIVQSSSDLVSNIRNTEEIVKAILDANRNSLMLLELRFTIWALGLGGGTFIASLYGMNLENFIEESSWGFGAVVGTSIVVTWILVRFGSKKLDKVTRLSMWGGQARDGRVRGKTGWARIRDAPQERMDLSRRERLKGWHEARAMGQMELPPVPSKGSSPASPATPSSK